MAPLVALVATAPPPPEHGIFVDHQDNVWIGSSAGDVQVVRKFSRGGDLLLQIGELGQTGGSGDTTRLGRATDFAVDPATNEVFISDGYGNRRVIVFDAVTGAYKRHWGAYGAPPDDTDAGPYDPTLAPAGSFRTPVHAVRLSRDGRLYVADRVNNRIQVFATDGRYLTESIVAPATLSMGSAWDMDFSPDSAQTFLYLADGTNNKIWILSRDDLSTEGEYG